VAFPGWLDKSDRKVVGWGGCQSGLRTPSSFHRCQQLPGRCRVWGPLRVWLPASHRQYLQCPMQRESGGEHWLVCTLWRGLLLPGEVLGGQESSGEAPPAARRHCPHHMEHNGALVVLPLCSENTPPMFPSAAPPLTSPWWKGACCPEHIPPLPLRQPLPGEGLSLPGRSVVGLPPMPLRPLVFCFPINGRTCSPCCDVLFSWS
jgi:hypothetical protein